MDLSDIEAVPPGFREMCPLPVSLGRARPTLPIGDIRQGMKLTLGGTQAQAVNPAFTPLRLDQCRVRLPVPLLLSAQKVMFLYPRRLGLPSWKDQHAWIPASRVLQF